MGTVLLLIGVVIGVVGGMSIDRKRGNGYPCWSIWLGIICLFVFGTIGRMIFLVPAASVGVVYDPIRGGIQHDVVIGEGFNIVSPFTTRQVYSKQTQEYTMSSKTDEGAVKGDDSILCQTNEGLGVMIDLTVLFHVNPTRAPELWATMGSGGVERVRTVFVRPWVREGLRMVVAKHSIADVYSGNRGVVQQQLDTRLTEIFERYGLFLEDIKLRDVRYAYPSFAEAINEKQAAQQNVSTERRNLEKARYERDSMINDAMGDYRQMQLKARALRENPKLIQYEMAKKLAPRVDTIYMETPYGNGSGN